MIFCLNGPPQSGAQKISEPPPKNGAPPPPTTTLSK